MKQLAADFNISTAYYSRMESGSRPVPGEIVEALALDAHVGWFYKLCASLPSKSLLVALFKCLKLGDDYVIKSS